MPGATGATMVAVPLLVAFAAFGSGRQTLGDLIDLGAGAEGVENGMAGIVVISSLWYQRQQS